MTRWFFPPWSSSGRTVYHIKQTTSNTFGYSSQFRVDLGVGITSCPFGTSFVYTADDFYALPTLHTEGDVTVECDISPPPSLPSPPFSPPPSPAPPELPACECALVWSSPSDNLPGTTSCENVFGCTPTACDDDSFGSWCVVDTIPCRKVYPFLVIEDAAPISGPYEDWIYCANIRVPPPSTPPPPRPTPPPHPPSSDTWNSRSTVIVTLSVTVVIFSFLTMVVVVYSDQTRPVRKN